MSKHEALTDRQLRAIADEVMAEGKNRELTAGYNGERHDGGGGALKREAQTFLAGLSKRIPMGWESYAEKIAREADPEWEEYQRLKTKFNGA